MYNQMNQYNMSAILAEDVYAPELRNPRISGMRQKRLTIGKRIISRVKHWLPIG